MRPLFLFSGYITPKLARLAYWLGLGVIALLFLAGVYNVFTYPGDLNSPSPMPGFVGLLWVVAASIGAIIIWRIVVEVVLVLFSIHDLLKDIRNQAAPPPPQPVYNRRSTDPR